MTIPSGPYIAQPWNANSLPLKDQADGASVSITVDSGDLLIGGVELAKIEDLSNYVLTSAMQAAPTKTTPVDADGVSIIDSAASNAFKRVLWSQIKATLKTYFDTLYSAASWGSITGTLSSQTDLQTALNAKVTSGGALGTPSSGTVTNLTGTASININGTVGATTATTGSFTTLNASGTVTATTRVTVGGTIPSGPTLAPVNVLSDAGGKLALYCYTATEYIAVNAGGVLKGFIATGTVPFVIDSGSATLKLQTGGSDRLTIDTAGKTTISGATVLGIKTIATLPSAASSSGQRYQVSDSATIINRIAFSNGSAWYYEGTAVVV